LRRRKKNQSADNRYDNQSNQSLSSLITHHAPSFSFFLFFFFSLWLSSLSARRSLIPVMFLQLQLQLQLQHANLGTAVMEFTPSPVTRSPFTDHRILDYGMKNTYLPTLDSPIQHPLRFINPSIFRIAVSPYRSMAFWGIIRGSLPCLSENPLSIQRSPITDPRESKRPNAQLIRPNKTA
jgi:hypothetical protein